MAQNDDFLSSISDEDIEIGITENDDSLMDNIVRVDLDKWFENSIMSPKNFKLNTIVSTDVDNDNVILNYRTTDKVDGRLYICSASLKSFPNMFVDFRPEPDTEKADKLVIYGHIDDLDNEFGSRLDDRLIGSISRNFITKYEYVELCGAFENIESMQKVISELYERLLEKNPFSRIWLNLGSKTRDDDGVVRTIASLVNSNYIDEHIIKGMDIVEFVFKRFDRAMFARLYTKDLVVRKKKELFDENENKED